MHTYDIEALYASIAKQFWTERERANATGGQNNIRAKGDGPEKAVRDWIAGVVGTKYRVTEGHVVTADGRKSKQMDVIVVWDSASGTLYGTVSAISSGASSRLKKSNTSPIWRGGSGRY